VASVPWPVSPVVVRESVGLGLPILCETPPAPTRADLEDLWADVGASNLVQVADQYPYYPGHAARQALVDAGALGRTSSVQVSSTHGYHAMALIRGLLGVRFEGATVTAFGTEAPLAQPVGRDGWTDDLTARPATSVLAHLDFGDGRSGLYDFTDNQWHNPLRSNRIVIRGSLGEIDTDRVVHITGPRTVLESRLQRRQTGIDMNYEGLELDHIAFEGSVLVENEWRGARLTDDELGTANVLGRMALWVAGRGPEPYPLAEGCQDHLLSLAVDEAVASGRPVQVTPGTWSVTRGSGYLG
jgi:predicted dehydrogenase